MILKIHEDFKKDYLKIKGKAADPESLEKNLKTIINSILTKQSLPAKFVVNRIIPDGVDWYECFVYSDKKFTIIMQYKLEQERLILLSIGTPDTLTEKRKVFLKHP